MKPPAEKGGGVRVEGGVLVEPEGGAIENNAGFCFIFFFILFPPPFPPPLLPP